MGRLTVELGGDLAAGKSNEFSMEHVRRHWTRRPIVGLDARLDPEAAMLETKFEVEAASAV